MSVCPHCSADLQGEPIPEESREFYGTATHWRREIGHDVRGVYDGVLYWSCPDCDGTWQRWSPGTRQHAAAIKYMQGPQR